MLHRNLLVREPPNDLGEDGVASDDEPEQQALREHAAGQVLTGLRMCCKLQKLLEILDELR